MLKRAVQFGAIASFVFGYSEPAIADTLYVPTIHVLQTDGDYVTAPLAGTEQGVSRIECEMRSDAWENEHAAAIAIAQQTLSERGEYGEIRITCERK